MPHSIPACSLTVVPSLLRLFPCLGSEHQVFNLHVLRSCASSIFTPFSFIYFLITSLHFSFSLPIFRCPSLLLFSPVCLPHLPLLLILHSRSSQSSSFPPCSTITTWGREGEVDAFRNMLTQFPTGLVACVSDSYDIWNACENVWGGQLKDLVVQRGTTNSVLVIRPDSGDPAEVVVKVTGITLQCLRSRVV